MAARVQLVHEPSLPIFPIVGGSVEVARRVTDHSGMGETATGTAPEAIQHCLMASGIELVDNAVPIAAGESCSIEVARRVADHSGPRLAAIGPSREAVQHGLVAGGVYLVHDACISRTSVAGSPVEVTSRVADHPGVRRAAVVAAREGVQDRFVAGGIDLVHDPCVSRASMESGSVEIARRIADHGCKGVAPIGTAGKSVQNSLIEGGIQLVHDAFVRRSAQKSSSINVTGRVADHSPVGVGPIGPAREVVQHALMAGAVQLVHYPCVPRAALVSSAKKITRRVANHSRVWVASVYRTRKAVEHRFIAGSVQLENDARHPAAACSSSSVEVSGRVAD